MRAFAARPDANYFEISGAPAPYQLVFLAHYVTIPP
jgi:hypothetical protein